MSHIQTTPDVANAATAKARTRKAILLALVIVLVAVAAIARFTLLQPTASSEQSAAVTHLTGAPPFGTATPLPSSNGAPGQTGSPVAAATPYAASIIPGYPDPRLDTSQEQKLRAQAGNPNKLIMVSITGQFLQAFENGKIIQWSYVTTGRPGLDTPLGIFNVFQKRSPVTFIPLSTDPKSADFGYLSKVQYGIEFAPVGYYMHDVWWRTAYGPGHNFVYYDNGRAEYEPGSHGCVNTPLTMETWLFLWADMGTTVIVFE